MQSNEQPMRANTDLLNVLGDDVPPLTDEVMKKAIQGRVGRVQVLDGSMLPQHAGKTPYALTHVHMSFENEDDLIRCLRMLQWSDVRMRANSDPIIMWEWKKSFRDKNTVEFTVGWYSECFFNSRKDAFLDISHASYYAQFGLTPSDIQTRHEII